MPIRSKFVGCWRTIASPSLFPLYDCPLLRTPSFPSLFPCAFALRPNRAVKISYYLFWYTFCSPLLTCSWSIMLPIHPQAATWVIRCSCHLKFLSSSGRLEDFCLWLPVPLPFFSPMSASRCTLTSFFAGDPECWKDQESLDKQEKEAKDRLPAQPASSARASADEVIKQSKINRLHWTY